MQILPMSLWDCKMLVIFKGTTFNGTIFVRNHKHREKVEVKIYILFCGENSVLRQESQSLYLYCCC
jgi:hypothetical protein